MWVKNMPLLILNYLRGSRLTFTKNHKILIFFGDKSYSKIQRKIKVIQRLDFQNMNSIISYWVV